MIGIDTSFMVAFEVRSHPRHDAARKLASEHATEGFGVAPQILSEFVHVVSDGRRFADPLAVDSAMERARRWWHAKETRPVIPSPESVALFLQWMSEFHLGRKRLLDTMLASTLVVGGVVLIATTDWRDFSVYPGLHPLAI